MGYGSLRKGREEISSYERFTTYFQFVYDHPPCEVEACSAADYTLDFCTVATASGWNKPALLTAYSKGLSENLQAELAYCDNSVTLDNFISYTSDAGFQPLSRSPPTLCIPRVNPCSPVPHGCLLPSASQTLCCYCGSRGFQLPTYPTYPPWLEI